MILVYRLLLLSSCIAYCLGSEARSSATVLCVGGGHWTVAKGFDPNGVAWGNFQDNLESTGWGILNVETNPAFSDAKQAYGAGIVEGFLTSTHIYNTFYNVVII